MSTKQPKDSQIPNNVVQLAAVKCTVPGCKAKPARAGFCTEHYDWFKAGLVTIDGFQAKDFDRKHQQFMEAKKRAA